MDDLQEQLSGARVEYEDGAVDRFRGQIALESLVYCHAVYIRVVHEPARGKELIMGGKIKRKKM